LGSLPPCPGRDEEWIRDREAAGDRRHSAGRNETNACKRMAGEGTNHYGEGYCWWCEQEYSGMYRGNGKKVIMEMETALITDDPVVELMGREVKIAEQQMEMQAALRKVKGQMEEMGELFRQVKELISDEDKHEALRELSEKFEDVSFIDPEQGEEIRQCVRALTQFTEKGQTGPVPISSDTKFQLLTKITEQYRKCAETTSRIAKDHFDIGKANMIPMHVLKAHIPMFVGLVNKVAQDDVDRADVGMKELRKIMLSIDQQAEEKR
jgi:hypothetical protein